VTIGLLSENYEQGTTKQQYAWRTFARMWAAIFEAHESQELAVAQWDHNNDIVDDLTLGVDAEMPVDKNAEGITTFILEAVSSH
jgi:hypothetical protein